MGFCVLHYDKQTGSSPGLSQHIERGCYRDGEWIDWHPANTDASRTHLNRELISGELSRDDRISKRIKDAGIKSRKDQVRALTVIMSASSEDMLRITNEGKFDAWCQSSIKWAQETHGADNVVSAVLHMDETTPHLHVTIVPIVQGISKDQAYREKKAQKENEKGIEQKKKRKYKRKDANALRLCAADVMSRANLKQYQTSYANAVESYGLVRGIDGSEAKHIDINDWYKSLITKTKEKKLEISKLENKSQSLKLNIADLDNQKQKIISKGDREIEEHFKQKVDSAKKEYDDHIDKLKEQLQKYKNEHDSNIKQFLDHNKHLEQTKKALNDKQNELKRKIEENSLIIKLMNDVALVMDNSLPQEPSPNAAESEWRIYYQSLNNIHLPVPIQNIRINKDPVNRDSVISADVANIPLKEPLNYNDNDHILRGIATKMQLAIKKFYNRIQKMLFQSQLAKSIYDSVKLMNKNISQDQNNTLKI